jgi:hypothetical protein
MWPQAVLIDLRRVTDALLQLIEEEGDDDVDMDSDTDGEDYDTEQSEVLLTKQEIEAIEI